MFDSNAASQVLENFISTGPTSHLTQWGQRKGKPVPSSAWGPAQQRPVGDLSGNQLYSSTLPPPAGALWIWTAVTSPPCQPGKLVAPFGRTIWQNLLKFKLKIFMSFDPVALVQEIQPVETAEQRGIMLSKATLCSFIWGRSQYRPTGNWVRKFSLPIWLCLLVRAIALGMNDGKPETDIKRCLVYIIKWRWSYYGWSCLRNNNNDK